MKVDDFVVSVNPLDGVVKNSVGVVKKIAAPHITVLFIGTQKEMSTDIGNVQVLDIEKTGKGFPQKICNICAILKNENEFDINQTDAKGQKTTRPSCKVCRVDIDGAPLSTTEKKRMAAIKPKGVFKCPICEKTGIIGITVSIVQDHCHTKGKGRDWICDSCNTGLGRFKDSQALLKRASDYLDKHK
jgi:hypothetical protein